MSYLEQILKTTAGTKRRTNDLSSMVESLMAEPALPVGSSGAPVGAPSPNSSAASVPQGGAGGVDSWVNTALKTLGLDSSYAAGVKQMIQKESSGNPKAINNWDSNAKKGTPSKGLMQTIDPTFKQWALPGYNKDVYDPVSNIIAGIRYAQNRYGDQMIKSGGRKNSAGKYIGY